MRHSYRYLPALLTLLAPLAVLALLGSRELSRQRERAETYLRERTFDFLGDAGRRLEEKVTELTNQVLTLQIGPDLAGLAATLEAARQLQPEVVELLLLETDGDLIFPTPPPPPGRSFLALSNRDSRAALALRHAGDLRGAADQLAATLARREQESAAESRGGESRSRSTTRLTLAGLYRRLGEPRQALALYEANLEQAARRRAEAEQRASRRRWRSWLDEHGTVELLSRAGAAELRLELDGDPAELEHLLADLPGDTYVSVEDPVLVEVLERAASRLHAASRTALIGPARRGLQRLIDSRDHAYTYRELAENQLRQRLAQARPGQAVYHVLDPGLATQLLVARPTTSDEAQLHDAAWVMYQLDLTAFAHRVLESQLRDRDDGFYLEILTPQGERVLRQELPEGVDALRGELVSRAAVAGLQIQALPRNAAQQLAARSASNRSRALLILALCVTAFGGAFFLLRSVVREAELASMKVDLVSRVSHELKTPLAMIKLYGETLELGRARNPEQATLFAGIISREADRLAAWVDRILDFSRRERGEIVYHREQLDLDDLVRNVAEAYRPHVEAAGMTLITQLAEHVPVQVDAGMMENAVVNLLENAVKYTTTTGGPQMIELRLERDGTRAVLEVLDRGIGIPPGEEIKIFDSFYRASSAGETRGVGLGLSLVAHFAKAHDGSCRARMRPGGGSVFRLELPLSNPSTANRDADGE